MKPTLIIFISILLFQFSRAQQVKPESGNFHELIKKNIYSNYKGMFRPAGGMLNYPFITPGSDQYANDLWDWDSWLTDIALRQVLTDKGNLKEQKEALAYERGCILNFLDYGGSDGYLPIVIWKNADPRAQMPKDIYKANMHKPVIAQHAAFLVKQDQGNAEWLREKFYFMQAFMTNYKMHHRSKDTGLYYWQNDVAIGVDNDPSTFFRPPGSSASIYLNCLMYKELEAMTYLANCLNQGEIAKEFEKDGADLKQAIQQNCWDERDGFFYSVDLNLMPVTEEPVRVLGLDMVIHSGFPRSYNGLIQRIGAWSGFLALWAGIATPEQAKRIVGEHYKNAKTFNAPYGVRTLSKLEKMYSVRASGNPSNWLGPVWGISNYLVYRGLLKYGFSDEAKELANKTILMFGNDLSKNGALHEYYEPESGEPILNKGFQNWNYLVLNMIAREEGRPVIEEF